jgi:DNA-binding beta-propeller fold protein YncE
MIFFNAGQTHAILSFVVSGHVVFYDAETRDPIACLRTSVGAGGARQAHAAVPSLDETHVVVANQNGKLLERIRTDYATNTFTWDGALDLAAGVTPNGVPRELAGVRPDNAPICPLVASDSRHTFVTLRGGGLFVVDTAAPTMAIVGEYDRTTVHGDGSGGSEGAGKMYVNSGGGTPANLEEFDVYSFPLTGYSAANPPNVPAPTLVVSQDDREHTDSHGTALTKHGRYLWVTDRAGNRMVVIETATDEVVDEFSLAGELSDDPSPDLIAVAPAGNRMLVTLRGSIPLSGDPHVSTGSTPGVDRADPHGIALRIG